MCYAGNSTIDLIYRASKVQEPIGPFYEDSSAPPTNYPAFLSGTAREISYFEDPIGTTMYYFAGSSLIHEVPDYTGKQVPDGILPSHLSLSQLSQPGMQEEDLGQALVDTQAYYVLYPKFKQIVSISDGNSQILGKAMEAMRDMYSMVLAEASDERSKCNQGNTTSNSSTDGQKKRFISSNLPLDVYAKSNKRIRPMGERGYKKK
jgi:hypothetical protein